MYESGSVGLACCDVLLLSAMGNFIGGNIALDTPCSGREQSGPKRRGGWQPGYPLLEVAVHQPQPAGEKPKATIPTGWFDAGGKRAAIETLEIIM